MPTDAACKPRRKIAEVIHDMINRKAQQMGVENDCDLRSAMEAHALHHFRKNREGLMPAIRSAVGLGHTLKELQTRQRLHRKSTREE